MKTAIEVTVKITVDTESPLDENSVKTLVNNGTSTMFHRRRLLNTIGNEEINALSISVVKLKENGKQPALSLYGTSAVPFIKF